MKKFLGILLLVAGPAFGQAICAPRDKIVEKLTGKYGEISQGVGVTPSSGLIEVWSNPETGTWSIIATSPTGLSCVITTGTNWLPNPKYRPARGADI